MAFTKIIPDIPTVAPQGTQPTANVTANAQAIKAVGDVSGQTVKDVQESKVRAEASNLAASVTAVEGAQAINGRAAFTDTGEVNTDGLPADLQRQIAEVKRKAGDEFSRISRAVAQGAMPKEAAAIEADAAIKQLINDTPGFAQDIQAVARSVLGYDPAGYTLRKILNVNAPTGAKSAMQKRIEEAQVLQDGLHRATGRIVPLDAILGDLATRDFRQIQRDSLSAQVETNGISVERAAQQLYVSQGPDINDMLVKVASLGRQGGVQNPEQYSTLVIQQREQDKTELRRFINENGPIDPGKQAALEAQIDAMYQPVLDSVKANNFGDLLQNKLDTIAKLNHLTAYKVAPRLAYINDAFGPQMAGTLLDMMAHIADPSQFDLIYQFEPGLKELVGNGSMTQGDVALGVQGYVSKIFAGKPVGAEDLRFQHIAESQIVNSGDAELRKNYVEHLGDQGSPIRAASILGSRVPRAQASDGEVAFAKRQFDTFTGEGVPGNLIDKIAGEMVEMNPQKVRGPVTWETTVSGYMHSGKLTWPSAGALDFNPTQTEGMKQMQAFIDLVNNGYAADFGVDRTTWGPEITKRINDRVQEIYHQRVVDANKQQEGQ